MKIVIALLACFGLITSLVLAFLVGGVFGIGLGYEAGMEDNSTSTVIEGWQESIDMGEPMPVGQLYDLDVLEMDAESRDVFTHFTVSSQQGEQVTITSGDEYQCKVAGRREEVGDAFAVLYYRTAQSEHQDLCEQALVYALHKMGPENAAVYLGLRAPGRDYPAFPEAEFMVYYTSKFRGLLAERYPLIGELVLR